MPRDTAARVHCYSIGTYSSSPLTEINKDYSFIETTEVDGDYIPEDTSAYRVQLKSRTYKNNYVTIPVGIKMKTKEIGYMTYFGEFGLNLAFRTGTKIADDVDYLGDNDAKADIGDITEDLNSKLSRKLKVAFIDNI